MSKTMRTWLVVLTIAALTVVGAAYLPARTTAANLTGGQYTYIINGEEVAFTFDPVIRKEGVLLPTEVFAHFGIRTEGAVTRNIVLMKDEQSVKVTLGSNLADVQGNMLTMGTSPLRLNGRLFLPADLLREFGIEYGQDGNLIVLRTYVGAMLKTRELSQTEWHSLKARNLIMGSIKLDSGLNAPVELTLLTEDMINTTNIGLSYGERARLLSMLQTNTLVMVLLSNYSTKAGGMTTSGTWLVDDQRRQYDVGSVMDIGHGLISGKLAPGADRVGVLVFPKVSPKAQFVQVYYEPSGLNLGAFHNLP